MLVELEIDLKPRVCQLSNISKSVSTFFFLNMEFDLGFRVPTFFKKILLSLKLQHDLKSARSNLFI